MITLLEYVNKNRAFHGSLLNAALELARTRIVKTEVKKINFPMWRALMTVIVVRVCTSLQFPV